MSRDFDELLSAYLDGEVSPEERAAVERRLEESPSLRETLDELSEVGDLVRRLPRPRAPQDLPDRVLAAISTRPLASTAAATSRPRFWRTWPLAAAGTVLAAGVMVVVLLPQQPDHLNRNVATDSEVWFGGTPAARGAADAKLAAESELPSIALGTELALSPATESLTDYFHKLERKPRQGEVLSILGNNAGQTQVLKYTVVDTREIAGTMNTILANNSFDVVVVETPSLPAEAAASRPAPTNQLVYLLEGSPEQVGQTLEEIETLPNFREVRDLGLLADSDAPVAPPADGAEAKPAESPHLSPAREEATRSRFVQSEARTPAAPRSNVDFTAPLSQGTPLVAGASGATNAGGSSLAKEQADVKSGERRSESGTSYGLSAPAAAPVTAANPRGQVRPAATPVLTSNGMRGVSAQLDTQAAMPMVENMLRNRAQVSPASTYNFQRGSTSAGQFQNSSRRFRISGEKLNRQLSEPAPSEVEKLDASKQSPGNELKSFQDVAADKPQDVDRAAIVSDPRNVPSQEEGLVKVLLILEPQPPAPSPAQPAEPVKKAGD